MGSNTYHWFST